VKRNTWLPYLLLTLTVLFWSGNFVLGRGIRELIPPVSLNYWRWVGALMILIPFSWRAVRRQRVLLLTHWKLLALLALPSITIFNTFIYTALQTTTAINTALVNAMIPIFISVIAWVAFKERLTLRQAAGVCISLAGLVFIVTRGNYAALKMLTLSSGDFWTLGASLSWAIYSVMLRKRPAGMDPIAFLTAIIIIGLLYALPFYVWEVWHKGAFKMTIPSLAALGYVALFPSVLSYTFWNSGVVKVGANRAGIFIHLMPVFSVVLAILFLDERLRLFHFFGILLIFIGIVLTTVRSFRKAPD
jgi:drug/metabolite transporter (DMT)-like permease